MTIIRQDFERTHKAKWYMKHREMIDGATIASRSLLCHVHAAVTITTVSQQQIIELRAESRELTRDPFIVRFLQLPCARLPTSVPQSNCEQTELHTHTHTHRETIQAYHSPLPLHLVGGLPDRKLD